jgi:hypothetical protein
VDITKTIGKLMAFGKKNQDNDDPTNGRYKVDVVKTIGQKWIQASLNTHENEGWQFVQMATWIDCIVIIYERANNANQ